MADGTDKDILKGMNSIKWFCIIVAVLIIVLFIPNQNWWDFSQPVNSSVFGAYGDFIGGFTGTIIGLYSIYLLVKTFINQAEVNKSVVKTNESVIATNIKVVAASERQYYQTELQLFDNKFRSFLDVYNKAIEDYVYKNEETGRRAFKLLANNFTDTEFDNEFEYKRRSDAATDEYRNFYSENRTTLSVHLRVLYLLVSLIAKSELEEEDKVLYAKLVRGQMCDSEMLIVRYNCSCELGKKMQDYCNRFNLIKHLPILSLLEFKKYRKIIESKAQGNSQELISGMNTMFIDVRKKAAYMLYDGTRASNSYHTSHRYSIQFNVNTERTVFTLDMEKDLTTSRKGGGKRISAVENALDCFSNAELPLLFKDFLTELFLNSNFNRYNTDVHITLLKPTDNNSIYKQTLTVKSSQRLALSRIQMRERDNRLKGLE